MSFINCKLLLDKLIFLLLITNYIPITILYIFFSLENTYNDPMFFYLISLPILALQVFLTGIVFFINNEYETIIINKKCPNGNKKDYFRLFLLSLIGLIVSFCLVTFAFYDKI